MPEVSIAVPTYNGALYLEACLKSAVRQTFADTEIVVVDDCSIDRTWAIVEDFSKTDKRIRMYRNPSRLGLVRNWNRCIQYCTGKWIKFLFQDDLLDEKCIEKMLHAAASMSPGACSFVVGGRDFVIEEGVEEDLRRFYENSVLTLKDVFGDKSCILPVEFSKAILERGVGVNFVGEPTSVMIRREICFQYSFFNQNLVHLCDLEYWTRLGTNEGLVSVPERLSAFRVHNRSASAYNHAHRHFQLECLDKIILLHDYLFHPYYLTLRKAPDSEVILSHQLKHEIRDLAGHVQTGGNEKPENKMLFQALTEKYPFLRKVF